MLSIDGQRDILFSLIPLINSCPSSYSLKINGLNFYFKSKDIYCCAIICLMPAIAFAGFKPFGHA